jgi:hypothetical protein
VIVIHSHRSAFAACRDSIADEQRIIWGIRTDILTTIAVTQRTIDQSRALLAETQALLRGLKSPAEGVDRSETRDA